MRRILLILIEAAALTAAARSASATEVGYRRNFGLGLMLGEPTGITGKYWITSRNAIDFGLGFGYGRYYDRPCDKWGCYGGYRGASINVGYLWHPSVLVRGQAELVWHVGVGGRAWFWDYGDRYSERSGFLDVAARVPIGLDLMFNNPGFLEIYVEIAPSLYLFHGPYLGFEGSLGIRFYF